MGPEFPPRMGSYPGGAAAQAAATAAGLDQAAAAAQYMAGHHGYDVYKGKFMHCLSIFINTFLIQLRLTYDQMRASDFMSKSGFLKGKSKHLYNLLILFVCLKYQFFTSFVNSI